MYRESPATRDASASALPPMWASMNARHEKRRVLPLTTSCAAALNVSWGTCPGLGIARVVCQLLMKKRRGEVAKLVGKGRLDGATVPL